MSHRSEAQTSRKAMSASFPLGFAPFAARMAAAGCPEPAIEAFARHYRRLLAGETGYIRESEILPVGSLPDAVALPKPGDADALGLDGLVVIKLNGGLGTSMGLNGPKSLLPVHDGLSFLDILARQILSLRQCSGVRLPLLLMNSFSTDPETQLALATHPELGDQSSVPLSFLQGQVPKISVDSLAPIDWRADPVKTWCPPGHGEIFQVLGQSGLLRRLLDSGYHTAFVSNIDNVGASVDVSLLAEFRRRAWSFMMEVADRTPADSKGGHLTCRPGNGYLLRELAQCHPEDMTGFQDIVRHRYFNTNNLWIHLPTLADLLDGRGGFLDLPMIRNEKPVDPTQPDSPRIYQLESAMGAAISCFPNSMAIRVPRSRFRPVKKTSDLLGLWSDAYAVSPDGHLDLVPEREGVAPIVVLDDRYHGLLADLNRRLPFGAPSLIRCVSLTVRGDVRFGRAVRVEGAVSLQAPPGGILDVPDGTTLRGEP